MDNTNYENIYIGKNSDKVRKKKFSLEVLLFGVVYLFYKKLYLFGLIWLGILLVLELILNNYVFIGLVILNIIGSFIFNKIYLKIVSKNVEKIINKNSDKSKEEIEVICKKRGSSSIISLFIGLILLILILSLTSFGNKVNKSNGEFIRMMFSHQYSLNNLNYTIPDGYRYITEYSTNGQRNSYVLKNKKDYNFLAVNLYIEPDYGRFNDIKDLADYCTHVTKDVFDSSKLKKEIINGVEWYFYDYYGDGDRIYYLFYFEGHGKNNYVLEFEINDKNNDKSYKREFKMIKESLMFE